MTSRLIKSVWDREDFVKLLENRRFPFTVTITEGQKRSIEQNKLQRMWLREASEQLADHSPEEYRAYCKLHFGVPILRNENDEFREAYDKHVRPHTYEDKLAFMSLPLDFPVTRLMKVKQKKRYLDEIYQHFSSLGVQLTNPEHG